MSSNRKHRDAVISVMKNICPFLMLFLITLSGCRHDGMVTIKGTITLDGEAPRDGAIAFITDRGEGQTHGTPFENGMYSLRVPLGECLIRISAFKTEVLDAPTGGGAGIPAAKTKKIQYVPEKYNTRSTLFRDVTSKTSVMDFELCSDDVSE